MDRCSLPSQFCSRSCESGSLVVVNVGDVSSPPYTFSRNSTLRETVHRHAVRPDQRSALSLFERRTSLAKVGISTSR